MPQGVSEALDQCRELADATADKSLGWSRVLDKGWIRADKLSLPGRQIIMRTVIEMEMGVDHALDLYFNFTAERKNWDSMSDVIVRAEHGPEDWSVDWKMKIPMMKPLVYRLRTVIVRDFPNPGEVTGVYVQDLDENGNALGGKPEGLGNIVIKPLGEMKCRMTSIEEVPTSVVPSFMMNWMIGIFAPRMMSSQISKYNKFRGI